MVRTEHFGGNGENAASNDMKRTSNVQNKGGGNAAVVVEVVPTTSRCSRQKTSTKKSGAAASPRTLRKRTSTSCDPLGQVNDGQLHLPKRKRSCRGGGSDLESDDEDDVVQGLVAVGDDEDCTLENDDDVLNVDTRAVVHPDVEDGDEEIEASMELFEIIAGKRYSRVTLSQYNYKLAEFKRYLEVSMCFVQL